MRMLSPPRFGGHVSIMGSALCGKLYGCYLLSRSLELGCAAIAMGNVSIQ